ncbi:biliverdin-producing heme oxygenase [Hymenobacter puniceus]|uniref:biliverdin-producing heme oxygenase n=1 Tax=Hymenobacter sp. BT190 TaxID=2763505 RepID=UPI00165143C1|nr:biliverdin-producing heme oxygenase [Hymenobacter sp. BT190]MBC6698697.1 biliverdin-producing heme oxygenase [Hymenobacter sp. BT190]
MPSALPAPGILSRLRTETRPYHDAVERNPFNQALAAGTVTAAETAQFLAGLYGVLALHEAHLQQHADEFAAAWELPQRRRAHLILADLPALGYTGTPPLCPAMPPLTTKPALLGALYVLEGSTLGGQIIARQLSNAGIPDSQYFQGYGALTGLRWKTFCQLLAESTTEENEQEIIDSSILVFTTLAAWLNRP